MLVGSVHSFEDHDFGTSTTLSRGDTASTRRRGSPRELCVLRVRGGANVTGFRYMKLKRAHGSFYYAGVTEAPLHRAGSVARVMLPDVVTPETHPFVVVLTEAPLKHNARPVDLHVLASKVRTVLGEMGFSEHTDYRLITHPRAVDITAVADHVLEEGSSAPATRAFTKTVSEAVGYAAPQGHGLVYVGAVSEWPTGRDHGSYRLGGPGVNFVSFCATAGFLTCSVREDCLGHELGHAFGMEHERHNWYGYAPDAGHATMMRRLTRCAPEPDDGWGNGIWSEDVLANLGD